MATRNPRAGGFFLTAAILIGTVWGVAAGEPSAGFLVGAATGVAIAVLLWLVDRRSG